MDIKRFIALFLAVLMLTALAVSCAENSEKTTESATEAEAAETEPEETVDQRQTYTDGLPEDLTFDGAEFRSVVQNDFVNDMWVEEVSSSDTVDEQVYKRNAYVEDKLDVKISEPYHEGRYDELCPKLVSIYNAGEDAYELVCMHAVQSGLDATSGIYGNWYNVPYMDFTQPWYPQTTVENLTLNGRMFLTVSDLALSSLTKTCCMFYDKGYVEDYQLGNIYSYVSNGEWTIDKLAELIKGIYEDLNQDGVRDTSLETWNIMDPCEDFYGLVTGNRSNSMVYYWAFNIPIVEFSEEGYEIQCDSEKMNDCIQKLRKMFYEDGGTWANYNQTYNVNYFAQGKCIFYNGIFQDASSTLREYDRDYGIIPYPKWDEAQEEYRTMVDGGFDTIQYLGTTTNLELLGAVTHALGCYSYKYVVPAYYDVALKVKGTRDEESVALLDMIFDGRNVDFGFIYDAWKGFAFKFDDLFADNSSSTVSSVYAANKNAAEKHYQAVYDLFMAIE